jgi:hypothetical protein
MAECACFTAGGKLYTAYLTHRKKSIVSTPSVVISAGAIMTPRLLMASGIGAKVETSKLGVESVVDNRNVGSNLQDHPAVGVIIEMNPALVGTMPSTFDVATQFTAYVTATQRFRETGELDKDRTGVFASAGLTGKNANLVFVESANEADCLRCLATHFAAGAFVVSPYATNRVPDVRDCSQLLSCDPSKVEASFASCLALPSQIQLTVFPRVTEPHIASSHPANVSSITQFLVTVALLKPDARHKMVVNDKMEFEVSNNRSLSSGHSSRNGSCVLARGRFDSRRPVI